MHCSGCPSSDVFRPLADCRRSHDAYIKAYGLAGLFGSVSQMESGLTQALPKTVGADGASIGPVGPSGGPL